MAIFNSYVKLPEGKISFRNWWCFLVPFGPGTSINVSNDDIFPKGGRWVCPILGKPDIIPNAHLDHHISLCFLWNCHYSGWCQCQCQWQVSTTGCGWGGAGLRSEMSMWMCLFQCVYHQIAIETGKKTRWWTSRPAGGTVGYPVFRPRVTPRGIEDRSCGMTDELT